MAFLRRLLFYIIGIGLGYLIVQAFFGKRDFDFAYFAGPRVLKVLRTKPIDSVSLRQPLLDLSADSTYYRAIVDGKVLFSESEQRKEPCGIYVVAFGEGTGRFKMTVENCDTLRVLSLVEVQD